MARNDWTSRVGTWDTGTFDNDDACDWADELAQSSDLSNLRILDFVDPANQLPELRDFATVSASLP